MKPPMNNTMVLFMNVSAVSRPDITPSSGNNASGKSAVANSGIAAVIHQMAISAATAARRLAGALSASTGNSASRTNATTPSARPMALPLRSITAGGCDSTSVRVYMGPTCATLPNNANRGLRQRVWAARRAK